MKKVILSVFMLLGMLGVASATTTTVSTAGSAPAAAPSDAQCKYKLADARAGLKDLVVLGFVPRSQSEDGNRVLGTMIYHDPKSKDEKSQDAFALVLIDKKAGGELTLVVMYVGEKKAVVYEREIKDGKTLGPCFEKKVEEKQKSQ